MMTWDISDVDVDWIAGMEHEDKVLVTIKAKLLNSNNASYKRPITLYLRSTSQGEYLLEASSKILPAAMAELKKWGHHKDRKKYVKPVHIERPEAANLDWRYD